MLKWLYKKNIDDLMEEGSYLQAMAAIHEELAKAPPPIRARPLKERLADVLVALGENPSASQLLRELQDEYTKEHQTARAIAIQKKLQAISDEGQIQQDVETIARWGAAKSPVVSEVIDLPEDLASELPPAPAPPEAAILAAPPEVPATPDAPAADAPADAGAAPEDEPQAALARTELFGDFTSEELAAVIREMKLCTLEPGEVVMVEGETTRSLYVLTHGTVRVYVRSERGESVQIREIDGVAFFGEISVVYQKPRTATITCKTRCQILELRIESVLKIALTHPRVKDVLKDFCDRRAGSPEEVAGRKAGTTQH